MLTRRIIASHLCTRTGCQQFRKESRKLQTRINFKRYYFFFHYCLLSCRYVMFQKSILSKPKQGGHKQLLGGKRPPWPLRRDGTGCAAVIFATVRCLRYFESDFKSLKITSPLHGYCTSAAILCIVTYIIIVSGTDEIGTNLIGVQLMNNYRLICGVKNEYYATLFSQIFHSIFCFDHHKNSK